MIITTMTISAGAIMMLIVNVVNPDDHDVSYDNNHGDDSMMTMMIMMVVVTL